jgi:hypothetical protein
MSLSIANARRDFERVLPRLVGAYESGRLVPFVGSGLSSGACTSWPVMIERLEERAFPDRSQRARRSSRTQPSDLIERANSAVRALKTGTPRQFERAMRYAVVARKNTIPRSTRALADVWWPLVLTTNYDNCYVAAFLERFANELYSVVGRSAEDCQRVLTSLSNPGRALVWALQGHMNTPCRVTGDALRPELERELVVGHEEYRRVTYRDPVFRRAFAEVFRQRSLFFLGAGIRESYLQELFGEVLEIYGPSARPHYAILPQGEVDPRFMLARFQIRVIEFPKGEYELVEQWLAAFVDAVRSKTQRPFAWSFGGVRRGSRNRWLGSPHLEIERSFLPFELAPRACVAVPAMIERGRFVFTRGVALRLRAWGIDPNAKPSSLRARRRSTSAESTSNAATSASTSGRVHELSRAGVFALRSTSSAGADDLTDVYDGSLALFRAAGPRYDAIHLQLAATRANESAAKVAGPGFPARFVLIQTVRAWRDWLARHPRARTKLVLHVLAESVTMEIAAGRLDVLELLSCDDVRFSTEIVRDDHTVERRVFELPPRTTKLASVTRELDLPTKQWSIEVSPRPSLHRRYRAVRSVESCVGATLHELGVVPGSTLHFRRGARGGRTPPR